MTKEEAAYYRHLGRLDAMWNDIASLMRQPHIVEAVCVAIRSAEQRGFKRGVESSAKVADESAPKDERPGVVDTRAIHRAGMSAYVAHRIRALIADDKPAASASPTKDICVRCHDMGFVVDVDTGATSPCSCEEGDVHRDARETTPAVDDASKAAHVARIPEIRERYRRRKTASVDDLLTLALWETWEAIYSLPPHAPTNADHAGCAAFRAVSSLMLAQQRASAPPSVPALSEEQREAVREWKAIGPRARELTFVDGRGVGPLAAHKLLKAFARGDS